MRKQNLKKTIKQNFWIIIAWFFVVVLIVLGLILSGKGNFAVGPILFAIGVITCIRLLKI